MHLSSALKLRSLRLHNRIMISPMCQYAAQDGMANTYHTVNYGRFSLGGAGLIMVEATAVTPEGRISPGDLGLWDDRYIPALKTITDFIHHRGAIAGIQLSHAGRKAAVQRPWHGGAALGNEDEKLRDEATWPLISCSALPVSDKHPTPHALDQRGIAQVLAAFVAATRRAHEAGFKVIELHCAHGYLLHQFLSPLSNLRDDHYGGDRESRMRFPLEVAAAMRKAWPDELPLFVRISAVDGHDGGLTLDDSIAFARALENIGVDLIDCSSAGLLFGAAASRSPRAPDFQVPYADAIRRKADIPAAAVGLILDGHQAEAILAEGKADLIAIGREALVNPNWPLQAMAEISGEDWSRWPPESGWWLERRAAALGKSG